MTFRRLITIILISILSVFIIEPPIEAAKKKAKATTSQSRGKSKSSSKRKSSKSTKSSKYSKGSKATSKKKRKGTSTSRKSKKKTSTKKRTYTRKSTPAPPPDPIRYDSLTLLINSAVLKSIPEQQNPGGLRVNHVTLDQPRKIAKIGLNENFTYLPVNNELINDIEHTVKRALPDSINDYSVNLNVGQRSFSYYITKLDKLPEEYRHNEHPVVKEAKPLAKATRGMDGDHVALWHSHGRYFKNGAWAWQRPMLFETMEDVYTMSYMLPYITPMLENAGAYVFLPRERDTNTNEVIVDFDTNSQGAIYSQPNYRETNGKYKWETGKGEGFIYDLDHFRDTENPFTHGTYRQVTTTTNQNERQQSVAGYYADIPEDGEYAVYVSYKTLPESSNDVHYTVNYSGGSKEFIVNQTMGGGTWIYLGTFPFIAGLNKNVPTVYLTNYSNTADKIVTADAVKIGGGMGNIERSSRRSDVFYDSSVPEKVIAQTAEEDDEEEVSDDEEDDSDDEGDDEEGDDEEDDESDEESDDEGGDDGQKPVEVPAAEPAKPGHAPSFTTSGLPRYLEGARYWLHWAGFPESVYSPFHGSDDYKDDYSSRGHWVNYLAGGSRVLPNREGLNIPIDMSMALHSDAGKRSDDSTVGTLGIYFTNDGARYADGTPRQNSRVLTDMLMRQITTDIRKSYEPRWTRRSMWDKSYAEARTPEVPTSLIELLSHQNFGDMQYGLDPNFRFLVGRAIYKGIARFVGERKGRDVIIQPLPVKDFAISLTKKSGEFRLSWEPTPDPLEPTAMPTKYIIMERNEGDLGFHPVAETKNTHFLVKPQNDLIHSYQVIAVNEGGKSFPSETLALRDCYDKKPFVLIVNGFDRVSAPGHFSDNGQAGFDSQVDFGVPYIRDISFIGHQTEFRRSAGEGFGRSSGNYINKVIAGNTFDFPYMHGEAIANADYGFISCSAGAVEKGVVNLNDFKIVDLILGKQKATTIGRGSSGVRYRTFPKELQSKVRHFVEKGGDLLISGQYVASDLLTGIADEKDKEFATEVLGIELMEPSSKTRSGRISVIPTEMKTPMKERRYEYSNNLNEYQYIVENPDIISPVNASNSQVFLEFSDNNAPAGIISKRGNSHMIIMSVPFESISSGEQRDVMMKDILQFLSL